MLTDAKSTVSIRADSRSVASTPISSSKTRVTSSEMAAAQRKVLIKKQHPKNLTQKLINLNQVSAMCPMLNLRKNDQHQIYLKANQMSTKSRHNKLRIQRYLREANLQLLTLQHLQTCFLKCDKNRTGQITRKAFCLKLAKNNLKVSEHLLNNLMADIQLNPAECPNDDTILVYKNLCEIIDIFQTCPSTLPRDRNQSVEFVRALERMPLVKEPSEFSRADELIQHANFKINEKYQGFRMCFRRMDKDFSGSLNFREFV